MKVVFTASAASLKRLLASQKWLFRCLQLKGCLQNVANQFLVGSRIVVAGMAR